ncbi:hypothetical protein BVG81_004030 [Haliangium sp. UPWRP_2]|nr:hypothetical protein BVG81_004030 [Haliangium sp. UPWRP_2]
MIVPDPETAGGERVKILDFGIAKLQNVSGDIANLKTRTGSMMGTPSYMSPEQARGSGEVDTKTDVYSLGVMLFQFLTGQLPFIGTGLGEVLAMHMFAEPKPVRSLDPSIPPELEALVSAMLLKTAAERPSMVQVVERLGHIGGSAAASSLSLSGVGTGLSGAFLPAGSGTFPGAGSAPSSGSLSGTGSLPGTDVVPNSPSLSGAAAISRGQSIPPEAGISIGGGSSTLGNTAGQTVPSAGNASSKRWLGMGLAAVVVAAAVIGVSLMWPRKAPPVAAVALPSPPAAKVTWSVTTDPAGALVQRKSDGQLMGRTPWKSTQDVAQGTVAIVLVQSGYVEKTIELDMAQNQEISATLEQVAKAGDDSSAASAAGPSGAGKKGKKGKKGKRKVAGRSPTAARRSVMMTSGCLIRSRQPGGLGIWLVLLLGAFLGLTAPALAKGNKSSFKEHYEKGVSLYEAGNFEGAITELQAAYALKQLPKLLLNIGQAHRKLGHAKDALGFYEFYLRVEPNPKPEIRTELERYIAQTKDMLAAAERMKQNQEADERGRKSDAVAGQTTAAPEKKEPKPESATAVSVLPKSDSGAATAPAQASLQLASPKDQPTDTASRPIYKKGWFWGVVVAGAVVVAAGVTVGVVLGTRSASAPHATLPPLQF